MGFPVTGRATFEGLYAAPTEDPTATIGEVREDAMGGRWRYCKAGAEITNPLMGAGCYNQPDDCGVSATAVGSYTLDVSSLGTTTGAVAKDLFANATIIIGAAAANRRFYHIRSNTASTTDAATTLTLYHPIRYAITGSEWATIVPSPYSDVRPLTAAGNYMSVVCFPLQVVTSGYYFWGKTRGPIFGVVHSTKPGAAVSDRAVVFKGTSGALMMADEVWGAGTSEQYAGYLIPRTAGGYGDGDQTIMLQLE